LIFKFSFGVYQRYTQLMCTTTPWKFTGISHSGTWLPGW